MTLGELNAASAEDFVEALGGIWEHSPWVAEAVASARPFADRDALMEAMASAVKEAGESRRLALLCAHPDLAGKLARAGALTAESTREQASAGLDRLSAEEFADFTAWNTAYRKRFGFPFIICVREHAKATIREDFARRLGHSRGAEMETALDEVRKIAEYRLRDRVTE